jgi:hypothetical protein
VLGGDVLGGRFAASRGVGVGTPGDEARNQDRGADDG